MIKFENTEVTGWEHAIRGMRNPMNSWYKSDSEYMVDFIDDSVWPHEIRHYDVLVGSNDMDVMKRLRNAGTDHRKFMRMITVYVDITAPLYWWKEFDTYKVGTVANSCSTMHKIHAKEFTLDDFSHEHLWERNIERLKQIIGDLNDLRDIYLYPEKHNFEKELNKKDIWWQMIQFLPSSYNQKRTVMMNYEVLANIYKSRRNHKLDEWAEHTREEIIKDALNGKFGFCDWIQTLPYYELITGVTEKEDCR